MAFFFKEFNMGMGFKEELPASSLLRRGKNQLVSWTLGRFNCLHPGNWVLALPVQDIVWLLQAQESDSLGGNLRHQGGPHGAAASSAGAVTRRQRACTPGAAPRPKWTAGWHSLFPPTVTRPALNACHLLSRRSGRNRLVSYQTQGIEFKKEAVCIIFIWNT